MNDIEKRNDFLVKRFLQASSNLNSTINNLVGNKLSYEHMVTYLNETFDNLQYWFESTMDQLEKRYKDDCDIMYQE